VVEYTDNLEVWGDVWGCGNFGEVGGVGVCFVYEGKKTSTSGGVWYSSSYHASCSCVSVIK
jgi:hypothetical protein